jgi:NADPH-dependent glutamate synthase beta subunit-like oxidoreductase/dihydroorotate dehydrogenase/ferredoxin
MRPVSSAPSPQPFLTDAEFEAELRKCLSCTSKPCKTACPCSCSPYDFIIAAKEGDFTRAAAEIMSSNPLGGVCGVVCPESFCVAACRNEKLSEPVDIPRVQGYIIRKARETNVFPKWPMIQNPQKKRVAIVGGGPCGLSACAILARKGIAVDVYEAREKLGGATYSIPKFRLPRSLISEDATFVSEELGGGLVQVRLNHHVKDLSTLECDALVVATGLQEARKLNIPGEGLAVEAMAYLWNVNQYVVKNQHCAIIGGGPIAVDVACTLISKGAASVTLLYRRSYAEMSITAHERKLLLNAGVDVIPKVLPVRIEGTAANAVEKIVVRRCSVTGGRLEAAVIEDDMKAPELEFVEFSRVFVAIGNVPATFPSRPANAIFAGDFLRGASTVVEASAFGKRAAKKVLKYFENGNLEELAVLDGPTPLKDSSVVEGYQQLPVPLTTEIFGIDVDSPFILSASPLTDGLEECRRALNAGWSGIITKTAFLAQYIHVPNEYMSKFAADTFGNCDNVSALPLETQAQTISLLRKEFPRKLIGGSTGGTLTGDKVADRESWVKHTKVLEAAGAQLIEYSLSCPQGGEGAEDNAIASQSASVSQEIVEWVLSSTNPNVPKLFKLTAAVTSPVHIVSAVKEVFARYPNAKAGITFANSFPCLDSREKRSPLAPGEYWRESRVVGMAGKGVLPITRFAIAAVRHLNVTISANGGIYNAQDACDMLSYGCQGGVQLCSAPTALGLDFVHHLKHGLSHLMAKHGFSSLRQLIGSAPPTTGFMEMTAVKAISRVDESKCIQCNVCSTTCPYGAISMDIEDGGYPKIDPSKCVSCGMCTLVCPASALTMGPRSEIEKNSQAAYARSLGIVEK